MHVLVKQNKKVLTERSKKKKDKNSILEINSEVWFQVCYVKKLKVITLILPTRKMYTNCEQGLLLGASLN